MTKVSMHGDKVSIWQLFWLIQYNILKIINVCINYFNLCSVIIISLLLLGIFDNT